MDELIGAYGSDFQGYQNYDLAREDGIAFVLVKATDGEGYESQHWIEQADQTSRNDLLLGFWHFWRAGGDDIRQARKFWQTISGTWQPGDPIAIDVEQPDDDPTPIPDDTGDRVYAWLCEVERLSGGVAIGIYCDRNVQARFFTDPRFARFWLWLAAWGPEKPPAPAPWREITVWQSAPSVQRRGLGNCTVERFYGDAAAWHQLGYRQDVGAEIGPGVVLDPVVVNWGGKGRVIWSAVLAQNAETMALYWKEQHGDQQGEWRKLS